MLTTKFINKGYTKNIHHSCSSFCNLNNSKIPIILWDYCVWRRVTGKIHSLNLTCFLIVLFVGFYRINIKHYPCNSLNICPLLFPLCLIKAVIIQPLWRYHYIHLTTYLGQTVKTDTIMGQWYLHPSSLPCHKTPMYLPTLSSLPPRFKMYLPYNLPCFPIIQTILSLLYRCQVLNTPTIMLTHPL